MAVLTRPDKNETLTDSAKIRDFLKARGIAFTQWEAKQTLTNDSTQEEILAAYDHEVRPFMQAGGFQTADVISVNPQMDGLETIRAKFLSEHTHSEDEVRFFVDGEGLFYFNLGDEVIELKCVAGDFLSVPSGAKHWFDLAPAYNVKAIRIFTNPEGWVANYTGDKIAERYVRP